MVVDVTPTSMATVVVSVLTTDLPMASAPSTPTWDSTSRELHLTAQRPIPPRLKIKETSCPTPRTNLMTSSDAMPLLCATIKTCLITVYLSLKASHPSPAKPVRFSAIRPCNFKRCTRTWPIAPVPRRVWRGWTQMGKVSISKSLTPSPSRPTWCSTTACISPETQSICEWREFVRIHQEYKSLSFSIKDLCLSL